MITTTHRTHIVQLCQHLHHALQSGVSIDDALDGFISDFPSASFRRRCQVLQSRISEGQSVLPPFISLTQGILPILTPAAIDRGKLSVFFKRCADYLTERERVQNDLFRQLSYPSVLLLSGIIVLILFFSVLLPSFEPFFTSFGQPISPLMRYLFAISDIWREFSGSIGLSILGICIAIPLFFRKKLSRFLRRYGPYSELFSLWMLGILLESGASLKDAFQAIFSSEDIRIVENYLIDGQPIHHAFVHLFDLSHYQRQFIQRAQSSDHLASQIRFILRDHIENAERRRRYALGIIQPCLLLGMGMMIFFFMTLLLAPLTHSLSS